MSSTPIYEAAESAVPKGGVVVVQEAFGVNDHIKDVAQRFDLALPENQRKLDLIEDLLKVASDAGCSIVHLAVAFVISHPAVTSAIIGPRTMEQLVDQLPAVDVRLDDGILDRIDEIVPPGSNVNPADAGWTPPSLASAWRRRRPRRD